MAHYPCSGFRRVIVVLLLAFFSHAGGSVFAADLAIYSDSLSSDWANWSWNTSLNFSAVTTVQSGSNAIALTYNAGWAALYLHTDTPIDASGYDRLRFWVHGGTSGGQKLRVVVNSNTGASFEVTAVANTWNQVDVPLTALGSPSALQEIWWQDTSGSNQSTLYLDSIALVAGNVTPPASGAGPTLTIDASLGHHTISDDIYGMNFADEGLATEMRLPVRRRGGNSTSRYNWQNDTYNTGSDWYFENIPENNSSPGILPNGSAADRFVEQDRRTGTKSIITVPLIGWVAKQRKENHPYDCGFPVGQFGTQDSTDPWDTNCGNGVHNGVNLTSGSPALTSVAATTTFVGNWISHLVGRYGTAASGGVAYYNLDNEPMLWNSTHRDIHPQPATYDELRDRTYLYAPVVKAADPSAKTLGPVLWGWCAYFYSASDGCSIGSDYQSHNNTPFVPWYLQQMQTYQQQHGIRILDYLDLHYYPQASGVSLSTAGSASTQSLRLRSTRSLWDPAYTDESWIGTPVRLIPRMKEWVTSNYPGTRLAITEYNWGGLESINGALAQADVLGIFGREGIDLATLWGPPATSDPGAYAFRIYRNYDGAGHGFGETGIAATSSDQGKVSIYASLRSIDSAMTVVIINKSATALTSTVSLVGFTPRSSAAVYRYSASNLTAIVRDVDQPVTTGALTASFPASSITLLVMLPEKLPLRVTVDGGGSGTVTSSPAGISCQSGSESGCTADFFTGTDVSLLTTASTGSVFGGWGDGCGGFGTCVMTMDRKRTASAAFTAAPYIRIGSTSFLTLQGAYNSAASGETISLASGNLAGSLLAERIIPVTIRGGYDASYSDDSSLTTIHGTIQVRQGSLAVRHVAVRAQE